MTNWWAAAVLAVALCGCTRTVDNPKAQPEPPVAPIAALQVVDLLSEDVHGEDGNLFAAVEPERCAGVAREVEPPFLHAYDPAAHDGGHWSTDTGGVEVVVEEMVAVYPSDYAPNDALASARQTVESCRDTPVTVTTMLGRSYTFTVAPAPDAGPSGAVLWTLRAGDWNCDNLFVAAHNAAIEMTSCGAAGGLDVAAASADALERIEKLANSTA